jgi:hypothetical protein
LLDEFSQCLTGDELAPLRPAVDAEITNNMQRIKAFLFCYNSLQKPRDDAADAATGTEQHRANLGALPLEVAQKIVWEHNLSRDGSLPQVERDDSGADRDDDDLERFRSASAAEGRRCNSASSAATPGR